MGRRASAKMFVLGFYTSELNISWPGVLAVAALHMSRIPAYLGPTALFDHIEMLLAVLSSDLGAPI